MAQIRLRLCAGLSEALLVARTTLLEISCRGSYLLSRTQLSETANSIKNLRSPRSRCFLDCTLEVDSSSLETAINNAHLVWEPE